MMSPIKQQISKTFQFFFKLKQQDFPHLFSVWTALLLNWLASYGLRPIWLKLPFARLHFSLKWGFYSRTINFRSRNAKKSIMGSNDLNYSLVSNKTLSQKIRSLVWRPPPDDLVQNAWTYPDYDITRKKTKTLTYPIFKNINYKTSHIFRGFQQLSYSIGWRVMVVQSSAKKWRTWY